MVGTAWVLEPFQNKTYCAQYNNTKIFVNRLRLFYTQNKLILYMRNNNMLIKVAQIDKLAFNNT